MELIEPTLKKNSPRAFVPVPFFRECITIFTPAIGVLSEESFTIPEIVCPLEKRILPTIK